MRGMPGENLTRAEARARSAIVTNVTYHVDLDLTGTAGTFESRVRVSFDAVAGADTWLDLIAPEVARVSLNGVDLDPAAVYADSRLHLVGLAAHNTVEVEAHCRYMTTGEGLHRFIDPVDECTYLYTQFEVADARRVFAVFEQPDIKAPMQLVVRAPEHWQVVSNRTTPHPHPMSDGTAMWVFEPTSPLPSYLYALVAGDYYVVRDVYNGPHGTYPLGLFCRQSLAVSLDSDEIFALTKQGFAFYEDAFGYPYPFGKYDQLFVPEFNAGAMENPGAVTFHEDHYIFRSRVTEASYEVRAETILHEMAHMWFGNLVTMRWWDDLWLNESFAEWAAHHTASRATRFTDAWASFANSRKAWAYRQDQLPSTHPIAADMIDLETVYTNFDGITYAKGASALKQLVAYVGEDNFLAGLRTYFRRHAFGNTEFSDLLVALTEASGLPLDEWAATWLQTSGANLLRAEVAMADDTTIESVTIAQTPPTSPEGVAPTLRPHRFDVGCYDLRDDRLVLRAHIPVVVTGAQTVVPELAGVVRPDLMLLNDGDLTYAKVRLDPRSMNAAGEWLGTIDDPLARAVVWGAAWDMTRDAELPTSEFTALVAGSIGTESDVGLVGQVLRQAGSAVSIYADPTQRVSYAALLADAIKDDLHAATPGSDHQLAFMRGFISFSGHNDIAYLRGLINGDVAVPGLVVDTDLRWSLVTRLVALGAAGPNSIEDQLRQDSTAAGQRRAITARAAAPDLAAKEAAWGSALDDATLANATLEATITGIMQAHQGDLVRPFVERYFTALPRIQRSRTHEIAGQITSGLYPWLVVEATTVDRTTAFLDSHPDYSGAGRRLLVEARDGVERALRCVARDRTG